MKKILVILSLLLVVSLSAERVEIQSVDNLFESISFGKSSTEVHFSLDGYDLEEIIVNGEKFHKLSYWNEGELLEIGKPDLPVFTRLIAIPNEGEVSFQINSVDAELISDIKIYPQQALISESQQNRGEFMIDADFYGGSEVFPKDNVVLGRPAIMRDLRVVKLTVNPFQFDPSKNELRVIKNIEISVTTSDTGGENVLTSTAKMSKSFDDVYSSTVLNYAAFSSRDEFENPTYLFIYPNDTTVANYVEYLADWKHRKGFHVYTASTSETGTSSSSIKSYIQNAYNTWEHRPDYICLVGDAEGNYTIPTGSTGYGPGDHYYVRLDGTDILADAIIGRLSFDTFSQLETIIAKILYYEKEPYLGETVWYEEAVFAADPSSSGTSTIDTKQHIKDMMLLANPNFDFTEAYSGGYSSAMSNAINSGVSYLNYRGYIGMSGFDNSSISALNNGLMLPIAVFLTCDTGTFDSDWDEARSETFIRAGSSSNQKGAIAAIGTATSSTHTCFNNCIDAGIYYGIFSDGISTIGGALHRGKLNLYLNYPQNPANSVDNFSYWTNLMGDPGMDVWTTVPQELNVAHETHLSVGTNYLTATVTDGSGQAVSDVWVTALMESADIFVSGYSDENGNVNLPINVSEVGDMKLTVTKQNYIPYLTDVVVESYNRAINVSEINIDDNNSNDSVGNDDGDVNPGETIELRLLLQNSGNETIASATATISTDSDYITVLDNEENYTNLTPGNDSYPADDFEFSVSASAPHNEVIEFEVVIEDDAGNSWTEPIFITIKSASLGVIDYYINGGDNIINPGETATLTTLLENIGTIDATEIYGELSCANSKINIEDNIGFFGNINAGGEAENNSNTFTITANTQIVQGSVFTLDLHLYNAAGFSTNISFQLYVGEALITDPLGPDADGYYIYDDGDVNYYNVPEYDWIEINSIGTNLNLNDNGNTGDIADINLPISFVFYGEEYNTMTVCSNGWVSPGDTDDTSFMNWLIPGPMGPSPMIAPFWDDLKTGEVYYYYNSGNHTFVVEWDNMQNEGSGSEETFQVILYDANYYPTATGNSEIKFQYKAVTNDDTGYYPSQHGQYATVGIEDHTGTVGLEYTFNNSYPLSAKPLADQMALLITGPPISFDDEFITLGAVNILDDNGQADFGETFDFQVQLNNLGSTTATNISATISISDPYVTLNQATSNYTDIAGESSGLNLTNYNLTVAENSPDGHIVEFEIVVNTAQESWPLNFSMELNAPNVILSSVIIDDNANNILDPGETADLLIYYENIGGADAVSSVIEFTTDDPYLTLNSSEYDFGTISSGSIATAIINVTVSPSATIGHACIVDWNLTADNNYFVTNMFVLSISQIPVSMFTDFSGQFPPVGWDVTSTSGQINWTQINGSSAGGTAPEAVFNWSPSTVAIQRLVTDPINTMGSGSIDLSFRHSINHYDGPYVLRVETTSDGEIWHTVMTLPNSSQNATLVNVEVQTEDVGSETFQLAFTFDGNSYNINYWYIDDVLIESGSSSGIGYVEGNVTLNGTAGNFSDVTISVGNHQSHPDENGHFYIPTIPGNYSVSARATGYETVIYEDIEVEDGETTIVNFELNQLAIPQNLSTELVNSTVVLEWEMERIISQIQKNKNERNSRNLNGFNVYRDGVIIAEIGNPNVMTFTDSTVVENENYSYFVTAIYGDGNESIASETVTIEVVDVEDNELENVTKLNGNYPNPFNGSTTISFNLSDNVEDAELEIYNLKGQKIQTFSSQQIINSSSQQIIWDAEGFASGIYFAKLMVDGKVINTKKMMLIK